MIVLLSPAKTLDENAPSLAQYTQPRLLDRSEKLVKVLKKKSAASIKKLMKISDNLAALNTARYQAFSLPFTTENAKPSILSFKGDVYLGLEASTFSTEELEFAQAHIRILSGLYGVLRPMDLMQAYRLEMGTKLKNGRYNNLYEFWKDDISKIINEDLAVLNDSNVINLASKEYFKAVKPKSLKATITHIHFKEKRGEVFKVIAFNAKKARGAMAKQIVNYRITTKEQLKDLEINGYMYNDSMSDAENYMFIKI